MRSFVPLLIALLLVGTVGAAVPISQSNEYSMSTPGEVDVPARNLTVDGEEYTVRAVGRVTPGETVSVDVSAPEGAEYSVYLYNKDLRIEATEAMTGTDRAAFSTDALAPGSYLAAVYDGGILDVYPVVVAGYGVTTDAPDTANGAFDANVTVADGALAGEPPEVQVVLGDDDRSVRVTADRVADGEYRATLPAERFEPGTYALYGVVRGEEETEGGDRVILAMSDRREVRLEAGTTPTPTATPTAAPGDGGDGGGGGGGGGQPADGEGGEVEVRESTLLNGTVAAGEAAVVRVELANFDPADGRIALTLAADGATVAERTVAVGASARRTVLLRNRFERPGTYAVELNGEPLGSLTVTEPTGTSTAVAGGTPTPTGGTTPTPTATEEAVVTPRPTTEPPSTTATTGDGPGPGAGAAALAVLLAALALGRR